MTDNRRLLIAFAVLIIIAGAIVIYSMSAGAQSLRTTPASLPRLRSAPSAKITPSMPENPSYDLLLDCDTFIAIKSTLEGDTGAFNWETETSIGMWDGIRTGGSPPASPASSSNERISPASSPPSSAASTPSKTSGSNPTPSQAQSHPR